MMTRAKGATLAEIMEVTGWQKHTARGFVSILGDATKRTKTSAGRHGRYAFNSRGGKKWNNPFKIKGCVSDIRLHLSEVHGIRLPD
jgi:Protein of unknown function (DUF3489)